MEEEGWRRRESFGAGGNSLTARGRRNGFWPDNAQVTHHPSCLLKTVISNSLPFLRPLIFSAPVLLLFSSSVLFYTAPICLSYLCPSVLIFPTSLPSRRVGPPFPSLLVFCLVPLKPRHSDSPLSQIGFLAMAGRTSKRKHFLPLCPPPPSSPIDKTCSAHKTQILISYSLHILSSRLAEFKDE